MLIAVIIFCVYAIYILAWWGWIDFKKELDEIDRLHAERMAIWDSVIKSYEKRLHR